MCIVVVGAVVIAVVEYDIADIGMLLILWWMCYGVGVTVIVFFIMFVLVSPELAQKNPH